MIANSFGNRNPETRNIQWFLDDKAISDALNSSFTPLHAGEYHVEAIVDGCLSSSQMMEVVTNESPPIEVRLTPGLCVENGSLISVLPNSSHSYLKYDSYQLFRNDTLLNDILQLNEYTHLKNSGKYKIRGLSENCTGASKEIFINKNAATINSQIRFNQSFKGNLSSTYAEICKNGTALFYENFLNKMFIDEWNSYAEQTNVTEYQIKSNILSNGRVYSDNSDSNTKLVSEAGNYQLMLTQGSCSSLSNSIEVAARGSIQLILNASSPYAETNLQLSLSTNEFFLSDEDVALYRNDEVAKDVTLVNDFDVFIIDRKLGTYVVRGKEGSCYQESNKIEIKEIPQKVVLTDTVYTCLDSVLIVSKHIVSFPTDISWTQKDGKIISNADRTTLKSPGEYTLRSKQAGTDVEVNYVLLKAPTDYFQLSLLNQVKPNGEFCEGERISLSLGNQTQTKYNKVRSESGFERPYIPSFDFGTNQPAADNLGLFSTVRLLTDGKLESENQRYLYLLQDELVSVKDEGNYQIEVQIDGCTYKTNTVTVKKKPFPLTLSPDLPQVSICPTGGFQTLELTPGYTYQWLKNEVVLDNNSAALKATSTGNYFAIASADGCTKVSPQVKVVEKNETPTATISGDSTIAAGATAFLNLSYTASPPFTYQLSGGLSGVSEKMFDKIAVSPRETTVFKFVSVRNSCGDGTVNTTASATITVEPLILSNAEPLNLNFNLYPVPLVDELKLTIDLDVPQTCSFWLYNLSGSELVNEQIGKVSVHNQSLDLAHLPAGTYIFKIQIGNQFYHRKIVKK